MNPQRLCASATLSRQAVAPSAENEKIPYASASGDTPKPQAGPDSAPSGKPAQNGAAFMLHDKPREEWLKWQPKTKWER